ncbi:unnamed protein product [Didymodactylos carnosus]|uniref:Uncharacterized protein n=2 Tax=Didymodactylos carnosus TaxID=1234261 RepID=A0A8S2HWX5_9BILA|nr:unnamed protein product [Didymodactylos carnosus]CAF3675443.1 unnamed protein product [Didymodactylos carnosus]
MFNPNPILESGRVAGLYSQVSPLSRRLARLDKIEKTRRTHDMSSPKSYDNSSGTTSHIKKQRELTSITNSLLLAKTLAMASTTTPPLPPPPPSTSSIKENVPTIEPTSTVETSPQLQQQQKAALRTLQLAAALNDPTFINYYQTLVNKNTTNHNNHLVNLPNNNTSILNSNLNHPPSTLNTKNHNNLDSSSSLVNLSLPSSIPTQKESKRKLSDSSTMTYLCRFRLRNRLIEIPTSEYNLTHDYLKQLIIREFELQQIPKHMLIIQMWNEKYREYIDIESFKRFPDEGRLQVLIEKDLNASANESGEPSTSTTSNNLSTTTTNGDGSNTKSPIITAITTAINRCATPTITTTTALHTTPLAILNENNSSYPLTLNTVTNRHSNNGDDDKQNDSFNSSNSNLLSSQNNIKIERMYEDVMSTASPTMNAENTLNHKNDIVYDLLPKPLTGIEIPRFPPHIAAFLNGSGDQNQLNALVQALYQEIVKYELYPNADELRSIVSRLVERYPNSVLVIGSIELLVRKLYYKFCNERKKYPVELKRRQPNKRKRLMRDDELMLNVMSSSSIPNLNGSNDSGMNDQRLDSMMSCFLWTNDTKEMSLVNNSSNNNSSTLNESSSDINEHQQTSPMVSPSNHQQNEGSPASSSASSSPKNNVDLIRSNTNFGVQHPLNLSISATNHLMCSD